MIRGFSNSMLRAGRRWLAPAAVIIACAGLAKSVSAQSTAMARLSAGQAAENLDPVQVLVSPTASEPELAAAAQSLLRRCDEPEVLAAVQAVVAGPAGTSWRAVISAICEVPDAPARLFPIVSERLAGAGPDEAQLVLPALGSYRTRDSVRILGHYLDGSVDQPLRTVAMQTLARLSAQDDFATDLDRSRGFVTEVEAMSESQWRARLIEALTAKQERTETRRQEAVQQLVAALRKLHLATASENRPTLLADLLMDNTPEVRSLGFELVARELSVSGRIDGPVGEAALKLLQSSDARVRSSAAVVVRQLAPDGAAEAIAKALIRESNPIAAADLLLAAARWPSAEIVAPVIQWISRPGGHAEAAAEAAWWLFRAGELHSDAADAVLAAVRSTSSESLTPAAISLQSALGDDEDRARLVPLLQSESGSVRQAVGEALLWYPEYTPDLLEGAKSDPDLFDIACRAVLVSEPSEAGVRRLLALPKPSPEVAVPSLLRTADGLTAPELLDISRIVDDAALRRGLLALLVAPRRVMSERADPDRLRAICEGVLDLAELELAASQPEAALAALDNAAEFEEQIDDSRVAALRSTSLVALGHIDLAANIQAPCAAWLRGLELASGSESATRIVETMEARFGSSMSPEEKAAFEKLKREIAAAEEARQAAQRPKSGG